MWAMGGRCQWNMRAWTMGGTVRKTMPERWMFRVERACGSDSGERAMFRCMTGRVFVECAGEVVHIPSRFGEVDRTIREG